MSVYGMLRTSVSGMAAQANRLGAIGDNIANVSTVGYKQAEVEFSSLVLDSDQSGYSPGSVTSRVRYDIEASGTLRYTSSPFDLAVEGDGFFVVSSPSGQEALTRAGAFVTNGDGEFVNSAGYRLMGLPLSGGAPSVTVNGTAGLEPVIFDANALSASPTATGALVVNVDATSPVSAAGTLPSANVAGSVSAATSSVVVYGNLGEEVLIDFHYAQTAAGTWEVAVFDNSTRGPNGFPYGSGPLATATLQFNAAGQLNPASATSITVPVPGGQPATFDLTGTTQLASDYSVIDIEADGAPASAVASVGIGGDGVFSVTLENGELIPLYQIPLATVTSPARLRPATGNTFELTRDAGDLRIGTPETGSFGSIRSGALENSNVDLGEQLTQMIESQRNYTANSKVFQTGSELIEVLVNLKR
jgi:flagellar hook protein FlgE